LYPTNLHSQVNLLITVFSTALIIAARPDWLNRGKVAGLLASVGTISYSLYLVHWPILAFLNSANVSDVELWWVYRAIAVFASFLLARVLYILIESKFRITDSDKTRRFYPLAISSLLIILLSVVGLKLSDGASILTC